MKSQVRSFVDRLNWVFNSPGINCIVCIKRIQEIGVSKAKKSVSKESFAIILAELGTCKFHLEDKIIFYLDNI